MLRGSHIRNLKSPVQMPAAFLPVLCLILLSLLCAGSLSAQTVLMGDQALEANLDSNATGLAEAFPFTATATGTVGSINFFLDETSAATKIYVGIYKDSSGKPGSLLTQGSATLLYPGTWNNATVTAASVTSGTAYWIAILGTTGGVPYFLDRSTTTCHSQTSSQSNLTSLPSAWTTGKTWNTCNISAYAVTGTLPATVLIGDQEIESNLDKNPAGRAEAFPAIANTTGSVGAISLYLDPTTGSGPVYVGLYKDNGSDHPGTLLGQGNTTHPVAGSWNQITIPSSSIVAGTRYWIAVLGTQATSPYFRDRSTSVCHSETTPSSSLTSLPSTWTTGTTWNTCYISAYGLAATGSPILSISSSTLSFAAVQGGANPSSQNLSITNTGSGTLSFTDTSDQSWLTATPASGSAPATLSVSAAVGSLAAGTYTGHVTVTASGAQNSPAVSTVTLTVSPFVPPSITALAAPAANANGWNNSTVTVSFTCTAGSYPIQTCPSPIPVTTQGANQSICGQAVDTKGNSSTKACATVSLDETPPTITATATPAPGPQGWNNTDVTVNFACSDSLSGVATCPSPVIVSASGANQKISGTATDKAGNTATASATVNVELTLPSIAASASPAANSSGWNNANVTVTFTCTQSTAPITSCSSPQVVSTEGANQVITGTVTDAANNTNTAKVTLNIGKTPPKVTATISPAPNSAGWNNSSVTVSFTCTAGTAPLATCPGPQTVSTQGANQIVSGTATDIAGNSATAQATVNIATTVPIITAAASPAANAAGWNNTSVTVTFTCTATTAPIANCPQPDTVSTQGASQVISGTVTDVAGNTATTSIKVSIATTPPTITASTSPAPNAQGWNNSPVTVTYTCTGSVAPIVTCPSPQVISTGGANQVITATATDAAGNSASASVTLNIGTAPPVVVGAGSPAPNAAGWNNGNVTVSFTCVPGTAPIAVPPSPVVVSTEGANQIVKGVCTDVAGNSATFSVTVNIDKTAPTITASASPAPNAAGWNTSSVTVTFLCSDALSGIAACTPPQVISTAGSGQVVKGTATDMAGNSASAQITLNISKTPPTIIATPSPGPNSAGWNNTNVTVSFTCTPGGAPITSCPSPQLISTEGASIPASGTVTDAAGATATATVVVKLDKTPPTVIPNLSPAPNSSGWETSPVTVSFTCSDSLSGVATCPSSTLFSTDGANQPVSGTATDIAGNSATATANVNLEQAKPTISASVSPVPNTAGWNDSSVTVTFTCNPSVSAIASCSPPQTVSSQGIGQIVTGTVQDQSGNQNTTSVTLNIDTALPSILGFTAPSQLSPGQSGLATITVTDIAPVASVAFQLNGSPIGTVTTAPYSMTVTAPTTAISGSTLTLTATVTDLAGNASTASKGIQVASSGVVVGEVLSDATGLPLQGATLQVIGQAGETATSDSLGRYSIPVTSSQLFLSISDPAAGSNPAMVTVERQVAVQSGVGTVPVDARLTPLAAPVTITASGGTVGTGAITLTVAAGGATASYNLTPLSQQGLPGLMPLGWSPVAAFDLQTNVSTSAALSANFTGLPAGTLYLVSYSYNVHAWNMVTPNLTASSGSLTASLPSAGDYALVIPDAGNASIQIPAVGQPLTGVSMVSLPATAVSTGSLSPSNIAPTGGTSIASIAVQSSVSVPSGTVIQSEVTENYTLTTGQLISEEPRYEDILLYQNPAPASGSVVGASFPVTPSQTFQVAQLTTGDVHLDILSGRESVRGATGGSDPVAVQSGDATLTVAAGSLSQDTAIAVTPESINTFLPSSATLVPLSEYNVDFSGQTLANAAQLSVGTAGAAPGSNVVIAEVQRVGGVPFLTAVSMANVTATNIVSQATPGLPGITQGGDYVFYELTVPTGFVSGTVSDSSGPVAAMVQTDALPFVAFSTSSGSYDVVAAAGTVHLTASIANTSLAGTATAQVTAGQTATANITVAGQVESATITPANGAVGIPLTAEIDITAADAFNTTTVTSSTVVLTSAGSSTPIAVRFVFSNGNTKLAVFPVSALLPSTQYTLQASGLANALGGLISVPTISFTTVAITAPTYNTNSLVFAMPDSNGNVAISAPAGSFPAGSTILIVDQTNGVVYSLTVFNDGSVTGSMPATINDILQVTLTDPAGNATTFTLSQFVAPDGTTAIGPGGGTVTGPGGTGIIIPAGALNQGTTFKLASLDQSAFPQLPSWTGSNFGSGMQITAPGMPTFNKEAKLAFPVPANAPAGASYYVYRRLTDSNNNVLFETIDQAFVQGTGASAQVVTASPPFCGYMNSYGSFLGKANAGFQPLAAAITFTFMMWDYDPNQAGVASQGVIVGFANQTTSTGIQPVPAGTSVSVWLTNNPSYVTTTTAQCGTYSLFDPQFGGGSRSVTGQNNATGQQIVATTVEVDGAQPDDSLFSVTAGLEAQYRNIGRLNFTFAPPQPLPPPPQINIGLYTLDSQGNRQAISGVVQTGTALTVTFSSTLSIAGATINGTSYSSVVPDSPPANPVVGLSYTRLNDTYTPTTPGLYTIVATAIDPLNPQNPAVTVSSSFLVVAAGGGNNYAVANVAPAVIATVPAPNAQSVSTMTFPEITFSEPVTNVPGNVTLFGSPAGDSPSLLLIGVRGDGSVANPVKSTDAITSLTVQPLTGLEFGEYYTLKLSSGIVNVGKDQNGNSIPQLPLPAYSLSFTTFGPSQLGGSSSANEVITRPVVIGNHAFAGEYVTSTQSGLGVFDITVPANPVDHGVPVSFVGRATDAAGLAQTPAIQQELIGSTATWTGQPLVAVSASTAQDVEIPGNVWLYDVSNPLAPVRAGGVSVTSSANQAGIAVRLAMKDNYLYASTLNQGLQVIDLGSVIADYQQSSAFDFGQAISTDGEGFAMDAIVNDIQLPIPSLGANPPPCGNPGICGTATMFGLQADNFVTSGGGSGSSAATQTLLVATGMLPLVVADPTVSGPKAILYPPSVSSSPLALSQSPLQLTSGNTTYQLQQGRAVALTTFGYTDSTGTTTTKHIAVVVGSGTVTSTGTPPPVSAVLMVVDMSQPYTPGSPYTPAVIGGLELFDQSGNPVAATDVSISGTVAFVATATNVLLVNLENPNQPTAAGQITGTFGDWLAITQNGYLVSTNNNPTNSIQTADLNRFRANNTTGHCKHCEDGVALPINLTNGNVYVDQSDYSLPGLGGGIQLTRTWNSQWESSSPVEVSGTFGNSWRSNYDERLVIPVGTAAAQPIQYWLGDGAQWSFQLGASGQTYTVSSPLDEHATLQANATQTGYTITFNNGIKKTFNSAGYLTSIIDRNGNTTAINYDSANRISNITSASGQVLTFNYGQARQVQSIQDAVGIVATYTYDVLAHLTKVAYADGFSVNMSYDPTTDLLLNVSDSNGKVLEAHSFDSSRRGLTSVRANGVDSVTVQYTAEGQAQVLSSQGIATSYGSASFGGRTSVTSVAGPGCSSCGGRGNATFSYDGSGNRYSMVDALGHVTSFTYDAKSNVLSSTMGTGPAAITWNYTYNSFSEVLTSSDPMGNKTTNTYDPNGNLLSVTLPAPGAGTTASVTQFTYNSLGQLTKAVDPLNNTSMLTYTPAGFVATVTDAEGNVTTYGYDPRGNRTSIKDALGNSTILTYDVVNRLTKVTYPDSTTAQFAYDYRGRKMSATDQNGNTTSYTYDDTDRLMTASDAANHTTAYSYDTENNLIALTDANGNVTRFTYDNLGRATQMTFPSTLMESYTYDAVGNLLTKTDRKNQTITYGYDSLNRMVQKTYPDASSVNYTFDNDSRVTQVTDPTGTYQYTFDNMGRITGTSTQYAFLSNRTFATSYTYDAASNRTGFTDPESGLSTYAYDVLNRLQTLTPAAAVSSGSFSFGYDALSRQTSLTRPNNVRSSYAYDSVSRLLSVTHQLGTATIDGATYTVDAMGNRTAKTDLHTGINTNYGYDAIYQLLNATRGGNSTESYTYDPAGNRLSSLGVSSYTNNGNNELVATLLGGYSYDNNGNALADPSGKNYAWDFDNRLVSVVVPGTGIVTFKYDPFGRRIQKSSASGTSNYVYDGADLIEELDQSGNVLARYTQAPGVDEPIAQLRSGTTTYYEADGVGSITSLSNTSGAIVGTYVYDAFGNLSSSTGAVDNSFRYTSREFDSETGLYYYRARYYDPSAGRFISEDPIGFAGGNNFYRYVGNRPTGYRDPSGLYWPYEHRSITYDAAVANGMSGKDALALADQVAAVDDRLGTQEADAYDTNTHAMAGRIGNRFQTCQEAYVGTQNHILADIAKQDLAAALHTIEDSYSPSHFGYQRWDGGHNLFFVTAPFGSAAGAHTPGLSHLWGDFQKSDSNANVQAALAAATRFLHDWLQGWSVHVPINPASYLAPKPCGCK